MDDSDDTDTGFRKGTVSSKKKKKNARPATTTSTTASTNTMAPARPPRKNAPPTTRPAAATATAQKKPLTGRKQGAAAKAVPTTTNRVGTLTRSMTAALSLPAMAGSTSSALPAAAPPLIAKRNKSRVGMATSSSAAPPAIAPPLVTKLVRSVGAPKRGASTSARPATPPPMTSSSAGSAANSPTAAGSGTWQKTRRGKKKTKKQQPRAHDGDSSQHEKSSSSAASSGRAIPPPRKKKATLAAVTKSAAAASRSSSSSSPPAARKRANKAAAASPISSSSAAEEEEESSSEESPLLSPKSTQSPIGANSKRRKWRGGADAQQGGKTDRRTLQLVKMAQDSFSMRPVQYALARYRQVTRWLAEYLSGGALDTKPDLDATTGRLLVRGGVSEELCDYKYKKVKEALAAIGRPTWRTLPASRGHTRLAVDFMSTALSMNILRHGLALHDGTNATFFAPQIPDPPTHVSRHIQVGNISPTLSVEALIRICSVFGDFDGIPHWDKVESTLSIGYRSRVSSKFCSRYLNATILYGHAISVRPLAMD